MRTFGGSMMTAQWDFFISYDQADLAWATWLASTLEQAGYRIRFAHWDDVPGSNWVSNLLTSIKSSTRTIVVLSAAYARSTTNQHEWQEAWRQDQVGVARRLIPVRVEECSAPWAMAQIVPIDVFDPEMSDAMVRDLFLAGVKRAVHGRTRPTRRPDHGRRDSVTATPPRASAGTRTGSGAGAGAGAGRTSTDRTHTAMAALEARDYQRAATEFARAIRRDDDPELHYYLGLCMMAGRRGNQMDHHEFDALKRHLQLAARLPHSRIAWCLVSYDWRSPAGGVALSPDVSDLLSEVEPKHAREIITYLRSPGNPVWEGLLATSRSGEQKSVAP
ncbi:toll/interleukin-1 receptor domain-containing protein [Frankia sp. AiPs1]|uniref:toll/interleukin-1 receptor domain-containing protein n=1 Tax=Frankia sp. AiPs1 TaxID=573493 RepID=UPI002044B459|nr:toll/interleukin-1 receptor domain-containing protein [Frankia sp. AiPs1]MCM3922527.1 toll/interleukin-1 receptor domain-containing protein [Frankia sp. AiPs1]